MMKRSSMLNDSWRSQYEADLQAAAKRLLDLHRQNEFLPPETRVMTATSVVADGDGRYIALDGSAHMMQPLFEELLRRRPELRAPMQNALDGMYSVSSENEQ